jgi:predicted metalloprotease with PDZ domain
MVRYKIFCEQAHRHFIRFEAEFDAQGDELFLQLPAWRPGRYELGNFAKNIREWRVTDGEGNVLECRKEVKDKWRIDTSKANTAVVTYTFYANELNAGSTLLDEEQLYINPVNCFLYDPSNQEVPYELELRVPSDYKVATGMEKIEEHRLRASGVQQLMDCPIMASNSLLQLSYDYAQVTYNIWVQGRLLVDHELFIEHHRKFTVAQVDAFGSIPCTEYHFMYQIPSHYVRHGVEHENSTVIAMGPDTELLNVTWYNELIGISCHELYHTWNIKNIRPADMWPYDFSRENYSRLGYVAEGVTTYYGDQYLHRCGVFDDGEYFRRTAQLIQRHVHNYGRFNLSVADSSFDTWLDGYTPGIPWRKVSIYNEGALCTFICDAKIIDETNGAKSLDDVINLMYQRFGQQGKGYTEEDYKTALEEVAGCSFDDIYKNLIWGTEDYLPYLEKACESVGISFDIHPSRILVERYWGIKLNDSNAIIDIAPDGPADMAGLWVGDKIISFNGNSSIKWELVLQLEQSGALEVSRKNRILSKNIAAHGDHYYPEITVQKNNDAGSESHYDYWKSR